MQCVEILAEQGFYVSLSVLSSWKHRGETYDCYAGTRVVVQMEVGNGGNGGIM